ncbi:hypothetical protein HPP92_018132 [Vanilla planifolia]|uniref:LOB domain-containing protein n=1 Tax=Vanilla planifolia TaxID=51239 RepID=A0A835UML0_VANPL|nr:hypothetical protein HPP92_018132 [Vanilla planifolia]
MHAGMRVLAVLPAGPADQVRKRAPCLWGQQRGEAVERAPIAEEDAVNSLAYDAEARIHDPVYGCVGYISVLQHRLLQLQRELCAAKKELSAYAGAALAPQHQFQPVMSAVMGMGLGLGNPQPGQGIMIEAQQLTEPAVVARGQGMVRGIEQQEMNSANTGIGFGHMGGASEVVGVAAVATLPPPALALPHMGGFDGSFLVQGGQLNEVLFQGMRLRLVCCFLSHYSPSRVDCCHFRYGGIGLRSCCFFERAAASLVCSEEVSELPSPSSSLFLSLTCDEYLVNWHQAFAFGSHEFNAHMLTDKFDRTVQIGTQSYISRARRREEDELSLAAGKSIYTLYGVHLPVQRSTGKVKLSTHFFACVHGFLSIGYRKLVCVLRLLDLLVWVNTCLLCFFA